MSTVKSVTSLPPMIRRDICLNTAQYSAQSLGAAPSQILQKIVIMSQPAHPSRYALLARLEAALRRRCSVTAVIQILGVLGCTGARSCDPQNNRVWL